MGLEELLQATPIKPPAVIVAAHPDDETLAMGGTLARFTDLTILQLTDGAPLREGNQTGTRAAYANTRESEAERALAALGVNCRRICLEAPDQESVCRISSLMPRVRQELGRATLVFTHPYEGGHPDHDTAALLVQYACAATRTPASIPLRIEFTSYHHHAGRMMTGRFWPEPACPETTVALDPRARSSKRRALAEYRTQTSVIQQFEIDTERYRLAPQYDFARPPPPGIVQYDLFGWPITGARWRDIVASSQHELEEL
jgi:LmbE family N-acetylglucosaminyl deacetylase